MTSSKVTAKARLYYIDFMKGVCILLIVAMHIDSGLFGEHANNMLQTFRVPLYYFLSGLFFKSYGSLREFTIRKTNNILVPLLFFYLLTCLMAFVATRLICLPSDQPFKWQYLSDPVTQRYFRYSQPLWFLLSLFEVNMIFYALNLFMGRKSLWIATLLLSAAGWLLAYSHCRLPLVADTALVALPFFMLGHELKCRNLIAPHTCDRLGLAAFPLTLALLWYCASPLNILDQNLPPWPLLYLLSFAAILSFFFFAKSLPRIPLICYLGEFSIILLCTQGYTAVPLHRLICSVAGEGQWQGWLALAGFMLIQLAVIPLCLRFIPWFVARKPLFRP